MQTHQPQEIPVLVHISFARRFFFFVKLIYDLIYSEYKKAFPGVIVNTVPD